jgi:hypothetical protein
MNMCVNDPGQNQKTAGIDDFARRRTPVRAGRRIDGYDLASRYPHVGRFR